jgi:hypothetical protein
MGSQRRNQRLLQKKAVLPDGKGYLISGDNKGRGSASTQGGPDLDSDRQQLEDFFDGLISEAEAEAGGGQ